MNPININPNERGRLPAARNSLRLWIAIVVLIGLIAGVAIFVHSRKTSVQDQPAVFAAGPAAPKAKPSERYCSLKGLAIVCQGITATGQISKYRPPHQVGMASQILPSPDESKFFIDTPANPQTTSGSLLYIADKQFKVVRQLPHGDTPSSYSGFDWSADSKSLVYSYASDKKSALYTFDIASGNSRQISDNSADIASPRVSADGTKAIVVDRAGVDSGILGVAAYDLKSTQRTNVDSSAVMLLLKTYASFSYSRAENLFYISGTSAGDMNSRFIIAKLIEGGDTGLRLVPQKVIDDGYAYVPQIASGEGMLVTRQKPDVLQYGVLHGDGSFQLSQIDPTQKAQFGLYGNLDLTEQQPATVSADDYIYAYVPPASPLQDFMKQLSTAGCPANSYSAIELLTQDPADGQTTAQQAALRVSGCDGAPITTKYYEYQQGSYTQIAENQSALDCSQVLSLQISRIVSPNCTTDIKNSSPPLNPNDRAR